MKAAKTLYNEFVGYTYDKDYDSAYQLVARLPVTSRVALRDLMAFRAVSSNNALKALDSFFDASVFEN